jgi:hypothetical protein
LHQHTHRHESHHHEQHVVSNACDNFDHHSTSSVVRHEAPSFIGRDRSIEVMLIAPMTDW